MRIKTTLEYIDERFTYTDVTYSIELSYDLIVDNSYGEDADGSRGTRMEFIDDYEIDAIYLDGNDVTLKTLEDPDLNKLIRDFIDEFIEDEACQSLLPKGRSLLKRAFG